MLFLEGLSTIIDSLSLKLVPFLSVIILKGQGIGMRIDSMAPNNFEFSLNWKAI